MKLLAFAAIGFNTLAILLLSIALLGTPPYSFFGPMKVAVAAAVIASGVALIRANAAYAALAAMLSYVGSVEVFAKMKRQDWAPYNWATILLLLTSTVFISKWIQRQRDSKQGEPA